MRLPLLTKYQISYTDDTAKLLCAHNSLEKSFSNSRLVFLGQFGFRGKLAIWIEKNINGTGTQLQHYLGNVFSQKYLQHFFDQHLSHLPFQLEPSHLEQQKHVFSCAFLGLFMQLANTKQLQEFIFEEFIEPNDHHLPSNYVHKNQWAQLTFLCKQTYQVKPQLQHNIDDNQIVTITIDFDQKTFTASSISYKYAKKKAIKTALLYIAAQSDLLLKENANHQDIIINKNKKKEEQQQLLKQAIQEKHTIRNQAHAQRMEIKRAKDIIEKKEKDKKRRAIKKTQAENKDKTNRKGATTIYRAYSDEELAAMSVNKIRNLQDKGIIPKGRI